MIELPDFDLPPEEWRTAVQAFGDAHGFYEEIGPDHTVLYVEQGDTLIVTFENLDHVMERGANKLPWGFAFINRMGWSSMGLMAHKYSWYRDADVYAFFERLAREGFFDKFEKVVFYGASMGAFAAAGFSSLVPGATVIGIAPQATLDRSVTSWETRYKVARRLDFSGPYGYAPDCVTGAEKVYIIFDPAAPLDAMHASLFRSPNVVRLHCRYHGHRIATGLVNMGILKELVSGCIEGTMDEVQFARMLRRRREYRPYLRRLTELTEDRKRPWLTALVTAYALRHRVGGPWFRQSLKRANARLGPRRVEIGERVEG